MAIAMFIMSSFSPLISIYIRDSLQAGPKIFGAISSMVGVGMILGTLLVTRLVRSRSKPHVVLVGLLALGLGALLLGGFHNIPMAAISTFTMGFAIAFILVPTQTMSQQETPPAMVGRVSSTFMSLISFSQVLGLLLSGILAQKLGIRPLFIACAGALAVISAIGYLMMRGRSTTPVGATASSDSQSSDSQSSAASPQS
jgi:DHA3 family macrolide efflux protein-like MFS transporter